MPRLTNSLPKYQKHRASGQAVVTLGGRDIYLGPCGTAASRREYDRLITEWIANGRTSKHPGNVFESITIVELIAKYVDHLRATYSNFAHHRSVPSRTKPVLRLLRDVYGRELVTDFGPLKLKAIRQQLIDRGQSRGFVNENVNRIRAMFRWGVSEELVHPDIANSLQAVAGLRKGRSGAREGRKIDSVPIEHVDQTLPELPPVVADMVRFMLATGCRCGEMCSMRPGDVDRSSDVWIFTPAHHKTEHHGKHRAIFIGPQAQSVLSPYLLRATDELCFSPRDGERKRLEQLHSNRRTPLSCGNRPGTNRRQKPKRQPGGMYSHDTMRRAIARVCARLDIPTWTPNQLRHLAATRIRAQYGLEAAQVILGHAHARISEVYAERDMALAARVAREVG